MPSNDEVVIRLKLDQVAEFVRGNKDAEEAVKGVGDQVEKTDRIGRVASAAAGGLGAVVRTIGALARTATYAGDAVALAAVIFGGQAVASASDLNETLSKTEQIFGSSAASLQHWAATADVSIGQSRDEALTAAANYGNFFRNLGSGTAEAAKLSKQLVITASDLASFNNATPEEMLDAVSSALAGEFDPLQRYGFAISAAIVQHKALKMGLAATTKEITAADTAQAAYAVIMEQTGKATGDFHRTSMGLANTQRIIAGQWDNLKAKAGQALLPAVLTGAQAIEKQLMPALSDLVDRYGPQVEQWLDDVATIYGPRFLSWLRDAGEKYGPKVVAWLKDFHLSMPDVSAGSALHQAGEGIASIGHSLVELKDAAGQGVSDSITVVSIAVGFLADHADLLSKVMPYLVAGLVAFKIAQAASNAADAVSIPLKLVELAINWRLASANKAMTGALEAHTAALGIDSAAEFELTGARSTGILTLVRQKVAALASAAAGKAVMVATKAWTAAQWLLNVALDANPVGLIVIAVVALAAGFILAWKHSETFRKGVLKVVHAVGAAFGWLGDKARDAFGGLKEAFKGAINWIIGMWNKLDLKISVPGWLGKVPGFPDGVAGKSIDLIPDIPMLASGGTLTSSGTVIVGDAGAELLDLPRGATVTPLPAAAAANDRGGRGEPLIVQVMLDRRVLAEATVDARADLMARL